jgi:hypothetical protein
MHQDIFFAADLLVIKNSLKSGAGPQLIAAQHTRTDGQQSIPFRIEAGGLDINDYKGRVGQRILLAFVFYLLPLLQSQPHVLWQLGFWAEQASEKTHNW